MSDALLDENTPTALIPFERSVQVILDPQTTDDQLITLWLRGKALKTQEAYMTDIRIFRELIPKPLRAITLQDLYDFSDEMVALAGSSVNRRMSAVKSLLSFAQTTGYLPLNAGSAFKLSKLSNDLAERILTEEEVQRMLAREENPRNHALLRLLYSAGLRVSEICVLTWDKVHEREGGKAQITIFGKGGKTRYVLITPATWAELAALREDSQMSNFVFRSRGANRKKAGGPLDRSQVLRVVRAAARRAGLQVNVSPHYLRHCHASHAMDRGAPPHLVQATLGHGSLATTGKYVHARPNSSSSEFLPV